MVQGFEISKLTIVTALVIMIVMSDFPARIVSLVLKNRIGNLKSIRPIGTIVRSGSCIKTHECRLYLATSEKTLEEIEKSIKETGDVIRLMKADKESKETISAQVKQLLALKSQFEAAAGKPYDAPKADGNDKSKQQQQQQTSQKKKSGNSVNGSGKGGAAESIMITPRSEDYSAWYNDVISASGMLDQSPVRGCMVIKPWGMGVWDLLRHDLDERIRETGASNAYFPLFIPQSFLSKEAEHVDGFAKECAVVTHHRLCVDPSSSSGALMPDPAAKLEEPLIVRPTSETMIWSMFAKWINSHRDLPLKINQWANVVRWELRTRPFLRSAEFLWQEGHTAHATAADAVATAREILDLYASSCEEMLALPTVKGVKSPSERFAGADDTYTIEALMQNGWALQSGTSHFLGQNFARAFDVYFQTENEQRELVWATSWGVSTRLLGGMVMTHSDDKGLVLPPPVAPVQVVIVPIIKSSSSDSSDEEDAVMLKAKELAAALKAAKIRVQVDDRSHLRPGAKYFEWERKGLPLRIDIGARDLQANKVSTSLRYSGEKSEVSIASVDDFVAAVRESLQLAHSEMLAAAKQRLEQRTFRISSYAEMKAAIADAETNIIISSSSGNSSDKEENDSSGSSGGGGFYLVPWRCDAAAEEAIKADCKATVRCYPLAENLQPPAAGVKCFYSGEQATHMAIFARAF